MNKAGKSGKSAGSASRDTLLRQWHMLRKIPRAPIKITAGELCTYLSGEGFDVSKRTVERDLQELSVDFPLVLDDRNKPYGWCWQKSAPPLDVPGLSNGAAITFNLAERYLKSLMPSVMLDQLSPHFRLAESRLKSEVQNSGAKSWASKVRLIPPAQALMPAQVDEGIHEAITDALLKDLRVAISYQKRGEEKINEYVANPLALVQRGAVSYLVVTLFDYDDVLMLAMHRIRKVAILEERTRHPKGFDIDEYLNAGAAGFGTGKMIGLRVLFEFEAGEHLYETPLSQDQNLQLMPDGRLELRATVADTLQLLWWLLAFGGYAEVVEPKVLRKYMSEEAGKMAKVYQL